jgi:hypothetical protein
VVVSVAACAASAPESLQATTAAAATASAEQRVDWNQAITLLRSGRVIAVMQLHDLTVTLNTADGARYITNEPSIDAILAAITRHAPNAQAIIVATE